MSPKSSSRYIFEAKLALPVVVSLFVATTVLVCFVDQDLSPCVPAMANTLKTYLDAVRASLEACLCLTTFPSQQVERHNKPEIEVQ